MNDTGLFHSNHKKMFASFGPECILYFICKLFGAESAAEYAVPVLMQHSPDISWDLTKIQVISSYQGMFSMQQFSSVKDHFPEHSVQYLYICKSPGCPKNI